MWEFIWFWILPWFGLVFVLSVGSLLALVGYIALNDWLFARRERRATVKWADDHSRPYVGHTAAYTDEHARLYRDFHRKQATNTAVYWGSFKDEAMREVDRIFKEVNE
jgi:hypothetical protein